MKNYTLPRLDEDIETRQKLLPLCRLKPGEIWIDPVRGHKVGCVDAADPTHIQDLMGAEKARLAIHDPPYNLVAFETRSIEEFISWCKSWIAATSHALASD